MIESKKDGYRERAKALYGSDNIEISEDAGVSEGDEGVWVAAWVLVDLEESPQAL